MVEETRTSYSFDRFTVDPNRRLLLCEGKPVQLTSKAFDLLLALVESEGRELTKDELMGRVWAHQIVEDANLTVTMAQLRKALGERAGEHRFVVTIPGRGYRFVGGLRLEEPLPIAQPAPSQMVTEQEKAISADDAGARLSQLAETPTAANAPKAIAARGNRLSIGLISLAVILAIVITAYSFWSKRTPSTATPQIKSIAVLPFKPLLANSRDESLEMGMADTLITRLSNIRELNVRPISSVRKYNSLEQDAIAAGREQRVDAVLDGRIQRAGEKIRVTVRLLRVGDGVQMWASQFDDKMTDIFTVQDSISERVTKALAMTLTNEEQRGLKKRHTEDSEAYQLYLKGRYQLNRLTDE